MMTPDELYDIIDQLDKTQKEVADMVLVDQRTIRNYLAGKYTIPGPTAMLLRILVAARDRDKVLNIGYGGK